MRGLSLFWRKPRGLESGAADKALESTVRGFASVDPDTDRQWRLLSAAISGRGQPAPAREQAGLSWVLRPALGLGLVAGLIVIALVLRTPDGESTTYETLRGQQTTLSLADGSEVQINHTSALTVEGAAGSDPRRVALEGEAFFRVRKTGAPFVVTTNAGAVTVLGTEFNVRVRDGRMEVAVVEGSVRVSGTGTNGTHAVLLRAGELTTCVARGVPEPASKLRHASYPGWIHGQLFFDSTPLPEACRELEDHFDIMLALRVPGANAMMITGALDAKDADLAIATLARLTGARYSHDQSGYTLR